MGRISHAREVHQHFCKADLHFHEPILTLFEPSHALSDPSRSLWDPPRALCTPLLRIIGTPLRTLHPLLYVLGPWWDMNGRAKKTLIGVKESLFEGMLPTCEDVFEQ